MELTMLQMSAMRMASTAGRLDGMRVWQGCQRTCSGNALSKHPSKLMLDYTGVEALYARGETYHAVCIQATA
jgi:hypothetical protein